MNALDTCNACDRFIEHPNPGGYCDSCLGEIEAERQAAVQVCEADRCWALTPTIYPTCPTHDERTRT